MWNLEERGIKEKGEEGRITENDGGMNSTMT
jgi:hypothetical protein